MANFFTKIGETFRKILAAVSKPNAGAETAPASTAPSTVDPSELDPGATTPDAPLLPPPTEEGATWVIGRKGDDVKLLQKQLIALGHEMSGGADGILGRHTLEAVEDFQEARDIVEQGLGPDTRQALTAAYAALLVPPDLVLEMGDTGPKVQEFQRKLIELDHDLPRFGADGGFGDETLVAVKEFQVENPALVGQEDAFAAQGVGPLTYKAVLDASPTPTPTFPPPPSSGTSLPGSPPAGVIVTKDSHALKKGSGTRSLAAIKGVTLHQTATVLGETPSRWHNVACHIAITRTGKIVYNNDFAKIVWHGNGFNATTIGIEIDGHFAGLESLDPKTGVWTPDLSTYWRPASDPDRKPLSVTAAQVEACKQVIRWIHRLVGSAGGRLTHVLAHRQSSPSRIGDPGERIWRLVAEPLLEELSLTDGGPDFWILDSKGRPGKPLPEPWAPTRHRGVKYRVTPKNLAGRPKKGP
jgi:peptidoglycan hydrolase-like protein with peptidoglycan-binding domain